MWRFVLKRTPNTIKAPCRLGNGLGLGLYLFITEIYHVGLLFWLMHFPSTLSIDTRSIDDHQGIN